MPVEMIWIVGVLGVGVGILGFDLYMEAATQYRRVLADPRQTTPSGKSSSSLH